ncbi:MAG: hypothetical protein OIF57_18505 [Marinobacterium sp.]|nr:hypothetical protein [Marinobacterium sp.]
MQGNKKIEVAGNIENVSAEGVVCKGLKNPRGMVALDEQTLLLIEAGSAQDEPDGRVVRVALQDGRAPEIEVLSQRHSAVNMQPVMQRDEIMGLSDLGLADGQLLVSQTNGMIESSVSRLSLNGQGQVVDGAQLQPWAQVPGHINCIAFNTQTERWFAVKPDRNHVVEFDPNGQERLVVSLSDLEQGQDAVPVYMVFDENSGCFLLTLFSGEVGRDTNTATKGVAFNGQAGKVISLDPKSGTCKTIVDGLSAPTGIDIADGTLYVLELCAGFLEPLRAMDDAERCLHGGFQRFSGRLLAICLESGEQQILAKALDTPSNVCVVGDSIYISEGMGMPGRPIPHPDGTVVPLQGQLRRLIRQR